MGGGAAGRRAAGIAVADRGDITPTGEDIRIVIVDVAAGRPQFTVFLRAEKQAGDLDIEAPRWCWY
jgi:hypothetical protein